MNFSEKVMRGKKKLYLLVVTLALGYVSGEITCRRGVTWWDRERASCVSCTRCDPAKRLAVMYPCELHRDTICQPYYRIQFFPFKKINTNSNDSGSNVSRDFEYDYVDYESEVINDSEHEGRWDLQVSGVTIAASGCVVFFLVVLYFSLTHARQWRVLKETLQSGPATTKKGLGNVYTQEKQPS
ncbi:unnamed protein product [Diatraea saccharalis]|uniref:TNFR-Cys domain-containing protein n=1 Tax=Diatraea saccharalis TaxID=40085 RepID=A0A9P0C5R8_9NEOP|nr:unnamed protein product [Diatraea saccharalis]